MRAAPGLMHPVRSTALEFWPTAIRSPVLKLLGQVAFVYQSGRSTLIFTALNGWSDNGPWHRRAQPFFSSMLRKSSCFRFARGAFSTSISWSCTCLGS